VAIDEFCKQLVRSNPGALAQWLLGVSGVGGLVCDELVGASGGSIAPAFYWQLIDTELAAETHRAETHWAVSHRADTVILQPCTKTSPDQLLHLEFQSLRIARWCFTCEKPTAHW
jgi:hypothetical protein